MLVMLFQFLEKGFHVSLLGLLRTVALKTALNGDGPKFCLGVIRAGVIGAAVIRANKV